MHKEVKWMFDHEQNKNLLHFHIISRLFRCTYHDFCAILVSLFAGLYLLHTTDYFRHCASIETWGTRTKNYNFIIFFCDYLVWSDLFFFCSQIELVDMHYGTGEDPLNDPFQFEEHMLEIEKCKTVSRGCFFLVSYSWIQRHYWFYWNLKRTY